jgi:RNA polymerase sigma-70 factor (ECF subfamily)
LDLSGEDTVALGILGDDEVRHLLDRLPPREREVITCTDVVGLDTATTAQILGMSRTAVRVARHRALSRLRG